MEVNFNTRHLSRDETEKMDKGEEIPPRENTDVEVNRVKYHQYWINRIVSLNGFGKERALVNIHFRRAYSFETKQLVQVFKFGVGRCRNSLKACKEGARAAEESLVPPNLNIPADTMINGAFYGDYNKDGLTDILITMSNGTAYLFEQMKIQRKSRRARKNAAISE